MIGALMQTEEEHYLTSSTDAMNFVHVPRQLVLNGYARTSIQSRTQFRYTSYTSAIFDSRSQKHSWAVALIVIRRHILYSWELVGLIAIQRESLCNYLTHKSKHRHNINTNLNMLSKYNYQVGEQARAKDIESNPTQIRNYLFASKVGRDCYTPSTSNCIHMLTWTMTSCTLKMQPNDGCFVLRYAIAVYWLILF